MNSEFLTLASSDPRPRAWVAEDGVVIDGWRCRDCDYPMTQPALRCPVCRGELAAVRFSTCGEVWASTVQRVRVPGYAPPLALAYLVLDDGPRVLVHTRGDVALSPGARASVDGLSPEGDLLAAEVRP